MEMDNTVPDLYKSIKGAKIEHDHYQSDLYFKDTLVSRAILDRFPVQKSNSLSFISNNDRTRWIDVPFGYTPYWENIAKQVAKQKSKGGCCGKK